MTPLKSRSISKDRRYKPSGIKEKEGVRIHIRNDARICPQGYTCQLFDCGEYDGMVYTPVLSKNKGQES